MKRKFGPTAIAAALALAAAIYANDSAALEYNRLTEECNHRETPPPAEPPVEPTREEKLTETIDVWLAGTGAKCGFKVEQIEGDTYIRATLGNFPGLFCKYDFTFVLSPEDHEVLCYGFLPTLVPDERRTEVAGFLCRAESELGLSPAMLVLDDNGTIRCQSWATYSMFDADPDGTMRHLVEPILTRLDYCSRKIGPVLIGCTEYPRPGEGEAKPVEPKDDGGAAARDLQTLLDLLYDEETDEISVGDKGDDWVSRRFGSRTGMPTQYIETNMHGIREYFDAQCDKIGYMLVIREGYVWNISMLPVDIPAERLAAVADLAMRLNSGVKYSLVYVDFDERKVWCQYCVPMSLLRRAQKGEDEQADWHCLLLQTSPVLAIANAARRITSLIETGEDTGAAPPAGEWIARLPLVTRMLDAVDVWRSLPEELRESRQLDGIMKPRLETMRHMEYCFDGLTPEERSGMWPIDVESFERGLEEQLVCDEAGLYHIKNECDGGYAAVDETVRRVNAIVEAWATNELDRVYARMTREEMNALFGEELVTGGTCGWRTATNECFVIQREDSDSLLEKREYLVVDIKDDRPAFVSVFYSLPGAHEMAAIRLARRGKPGSGQNCAAMMYNGVLDRYSADRGAVKALLDLAADNGFSEAIRNLELLEGEK